MLMSKNVNNDVSKDSRWLDFDQAFMNRDRKRFFCLQLPVNEAYGSTQWKMTHLLRSCVKTDNNCNRTLMDLDCLW